MTMKQLVRRGQGAWLQRGELGTPGCHGRRRRLRACRQLQGGHDLAEYVGFLTGWATSAEWEGSFKRITEAPGLVFLELEERSRYGEMTSVVNSVSVYEFDEDGKIVHLDIYLQMPLPTRACSAATRASTSASGGAGAAAQGVEEGGRQHMAKGYVILTEDIHDPAGMAAHGALSYDSLVEHGAKMLVVDDEYDTREGVSSVGESDHRVRVGGQGAELVRVRGRPGRPRPAAGGGGLHGRDRLGVRPLAARQQAGVARQPAPSARALDATTGRRSFESSGPLSATEVRSRQP